MRPGSSRPAGIGVSARARSPRARPATARARTPSGLGGEPWGDLSAAGARPPSGRPRAGRRSRGPPRLCTERENRCRYSTRWHPRLLRIRAGGQRRRARAAMKAWRSPRGGRPPPTPLWALVGMAPSGARSGPVDLCAAAARPQAPRRSSTASRQPSPSSQPRARQLCSALRADCRSSFRCARAFQEALCSFCQPWLMVFGLKQSSSSAKVTVARWRPPACRPAAPLRTSSSGPDLGGFPPRSGRPRRPRPRAMPPGWRPPQTGPPPARGACRPPPSSSSPRRSPGCRDPSRSRPRASPRAWRATRPRPPVAARGRRSAGRSRWPPCSRGSSQGSPRRRRTSRAGRPGPRRIVRRRVCRGPPPEADCPRRRASSPAGGVVLRAGGPSWQGGGPWRQTRQRALGLLLLVLRLLPHWRQCCQSS